MSEAGNPGSRLVVGGRLAVVAAVVIVFLVGSAAAVTAASVSRLARTEVELAALRTQASAAPSARPSATPSPTPRGSAMPSGPDPQMLAIIDGLLATCVEPLKRLATDQASQITAFRSAINGLEFNKWADAVQDAKGSYVDAYNSLRSAASYYRNYYDSANPAAKPPLAAADTRATAQKRAGDQRWAAAVAASKRTSKALDKIPTAAVKTDAKCPPAPSATPAPGASGSPAPSATPKP